MQTRSLLASLALALLLTTSCKDNDAKPEPAAASSTAAATSAPPSATPPAATDSAPLAATVAADAGASGVETPATAEPEKHEADLKAVQEVVDQVCACTTAECVQAAAERLNHDFKGIKDVDEAAAKPLLVKMAGCAMKIAGGAVPSGDGKAVVKEFTDAVDVACACKDLDCISKAGLKLGDVAKKIGAALGSVENAEALQKQGERLKTCMSALATHPPAGTTASIAPPSALSYRTYKNTRYGYVIDVASIFTGGTAFMGIAGQEWKWLDKALMNVAAIDGKGMSIKDWYDAAKKEPGVMGSNINGNWFMKTGKKSGKIFWQKSFLKDNLLYTARLEYEEALKVFFDPIVSRASRTFKTP